VFTKQQVDFEHPAKGMHHCGECKHFIRGNACWIVAGVIKPQDWCSKWEKKVAKQEYKEARNEEAAKEPKAKLHHLRIHPHKGGHLVTHHAAHPMGGHEEHPFASHVFAKEDGAGLMAHIAKHGKVLNPEMVGEGERQEGPAEETKEGEE
jgi:hypothetical protein